MVPSSEGQLCLTTYTVLDRRAGTSRVALVPHTGRTHQLRAHLSAIGHPIVGDNIYGGDSSPAGSGSLCLHAKALRFTEPDSGVPWLVQSERDWIDRH